MWWLKSKDSDTVFHHLKHNWVSLVLYYRRLHHPQSFTATSNSNFKKVNYDGNSTRLADKKNSNFTTVCILHLCSMTRLCFIHILGINAICPLDSSSNTKKEVEVIFWEVHLLLKSFFVLLIDDHICFRRLLFLLIKVMLNAILLPDDFVPSEQLAAVVGGGLGGS